MLDIGMFYLFVYLFICLFNFYFFVGVHFFCGVWGIMLGMYVGYWVSLFFVGVQGIMTHMQVHARAHMNMHTRPHTHSGSRTPTHSIHMHAHSGTCTFMHKSVCLLAVACSLVCPLSTSQFQNRNQLRVPIQEPEEMFVCPPVCLSVCHSVCQFVWLYVYIFLSMLLSFCLSVGLLVCLFVCLHMPLRPQEAMECRT